MKAKALLPMVTPCKIPEQQTHKSLVWKKYRATQTLWAWRLNKRRGWKSPKIQQTKILVIGPRFGDFFFRLVWQYSTNQKLYNLGRFKVIANIAAVI